jgi:hypothetical protein
MTPRHALLTAALALAFTSPAPADLILLSGNNMDPNGALPGIITSLCHSSAFVSPSSFDGSTINFSGVKLVWLDGYSNFANLGSSNLINFMNNGGNLLVQNPGFGTQPASAYPFGSEIANVFLSSDTVRITNTTHPLNAGLTDAGLSGWNFATDGFFGTIGSFTAISDNGTTGAAVTLVRHVGAGFLIYTDQETSVSTSSTVRGPRGRTVPRATS